MGRRVQLRELANARSGDKGADANVGVWTATDEDYELLREVLTADVVKEHFASLCRGDVVRYELPRLRALNFVLQDALGGGASQSLRTDAQGKTFGTGLLLLEVDLPDRSER